ncbi:hypothetical protein BE17_30285 [Sorangium cellulosum]|uniref:Uncharacterized protein n=1 Tax=Sorangium cellulosum TaxID=56 RepID=A0A150RS60_SORCE|nr:hypothetical protein BE17_30285 [Sorangium cellulosum]
MQVAEQGIIVMNGLDPDFFWRSSTQQALRALGRAPLEEALTGAGGSVLLTSDEGRELAARVVACALPEGATLEAGSRRSFDGSIGLAPRWASAPLSGAASRRWVTACLLQSLNALDAHVDVRLTGGHPGLADAPGSDAQDYSVRDAIMFGDLFDPVRPAAFACADNALIDECGVALSVKTLERICGQSPTCRLTLLGHCDAVCSRDSAGAPTCRAPGSGVYPESIASSLEPHVALSTGGLPCDALGFITGLL